MSAFLENFSTTSWVISQSEPLNLMYITKHTGHMVVFERTEKWPRIVGTVSIGTALGREMWV